MILYSRVVWTTVSGLHRKRPSDIKFPLWPHENVKCLVRLFCDFFISFHFCLFQWSSSRRVIRFRSHKEWGLNRGS